MFVRCDLTAVAPLRNCAKTGLKTAPPPTTDVMCLFQGELPGRRHPRLPTEGDEWRGRRGGPRADDPAPRRRRPAHLAGHTGLIHKPTRRVRAARGVRHAEPADSEARARGPEPPPEVGLGIARFRQSRRVHHRQQAAATQGD